jgi:hypothetical protein
MKFGKRREINEEESGVPTLKSQVRSNSCFTRREVAVGKATTYLSLTLIMKKLKNNVEQCRVVTTSNTKNHF